MSKNQIPRSASEVPYVVYVVRCADGTFYTGITTDLTRRVMEHNESEKGARYTKPRRPVTLAYSETVIGRSEAQRREYEIRQLSRQQKEALTA